MARSARHAFPNFSGDHYSSVTWGIVTVAIDFLGHYAETPMWRLDETAREAIRRGLRALLVEQKSERPSRYAVCSAARTIGEKIRNDRQLAKIGSLCDDIVLISLLGARDRALAGVRLYRSDEQLPCRPTTPFPPRSKPHLSNLFGDLPLLCFRGDEDRGRLQRPRRAADHNSVSIELPLRIEYLHSQARHCHAGGDCICGRI